MAKKDDRLIYLYWDKLREQWRLRFRPKNLVDPRNPKRQYSEWLPKGYSESQAIAHRENLLALDQKGLLLWPEQRNTKKRRESWLIGDFFLDVYYELHVKNKAINTQLNATKTYKRIFPILGNLYVNDVTKEDLLVLVRYLKEEARSGKGYRDSTVKLDLQTCTKMLNFANDHGYRSKPSPKVSHQIRDAKEKHWLTQKQALILVNWKKRQNLESDNVDSHAEYIAALLALYTGGRSTELQNLRWRDIDFERQTVHFAITKAYRVRTIPVLRFLLDELPSWRERQRQACGERDKVLDLPHRFGKIKSLDLSRRAVKGKYDHPDIPFHVTAHTFRRTYGTRLLEHTGDLYFVSKCLGHSSVEVTAKHYIHALPKNYGHKMLGAFDFLEQGLSEEAEDSEIDSKLTQDAKKDSLRAE